jgi:hypothetical protein
LNEAPPGSFGQDVPFALEGDDRTYKQFGSKNGSGPASPLPAAVVFEELDACFVVPSIHAKNALARLYSR